MLSIHDLTFRKGKSILINKISSSIENGEIAGITGTAGSGKKTLISILARDEKQYEGTILIDDVDIKKINKKSFSRLLTHNSPMNDNGNPESYVKEWILGGRIAHKKILNPYSENDKDIANKELLNFGLDGLSETKLKRISWTSFRMTSLARTFASRSDILLLEKPEAGLDLKQRHLLSRNIKKYTSSGGKIVILTSGDLNFLAATCDRIIVLDNGHIAETGTGKIITESFVRKYFNVEVVITKNIITGLPEIQVIEEN
jgi:ABC-type cobalamin/Fe3+-siderophores transport system ATPase subunit